MITGTPQAIPSQPVSVAGEQTTHGETSYWFEGNPHLERMHAPEPTFAGARGKLHMARTDKAKRPIDLIVSVVLMALTLPVLVIAAAGSAISLRAWPFFVHTRIGFDGEPFKFVKLRTLPKSVPRYAAKHELAHLRLPWFCRLMRRTHLDELPQLGLVALGKMSLVGPRPEMKGLHDALPRTFALERTSVRPGCTGLWQISEHCTKMIHEHPEVDDFYIGHRSLRFDIWIMFQTLLILFSARRSLLRMDDIPNWVARDALRPRASMRSAHRTERTLVAAQPHEGRARG